MPGGGEPIAPHQVDDLIASMKAGDRVVYHTGNLVNDRDKSGEDAQRLGAMTDRFYTHGTPAAFSWAGDRAADGLGTGSLVQRRVDREMYEYLFIKGSKP